MCSAHSFMSGSPVMIIAKWHDVCFQRWSCNRSLYRTKVSRKFFRTKSWISICGDTLAVFVHVVTYHSCNYLSKEKGASCYVHQHQHCNVAPHREHKIPEPLVKISNSSYITSTILEPTCVWQFPGFPNSTTHCCSGQHWVQLFGELHDL